ncbi:iron chaperone [Youngiibacter multivorans]|uniref:Uncharacterized protein YdhG (YjbR/CyaY superfamily) n=1 Tax=Youngiibacter multivorans TaxID=937251 RepID=A0ABS4G8S8_9CLOT|nr:DUF1801 domain-containing protein [Youngiibacter multivorans]MBP1920970.1 uncharacterized protein YdhG (YjbR/CyaY superfamily) [Youngiibacter multivorans]
MADKPKTVEEYVAALPEGAQRHFREIMAILSDAAPEASVALKWGTPAFSYDRILFTVAAYKKHMNFCPTPAVISACKAELTAQKVTDCVLQIPYDKPIPVEIVRKLAECRIRDLVENDARWM